MVPFGRKNRLVPFVLAAAVCGPLASAAFSDTVTLSTTAFDNATVQPAGPRTGGNGKAFFNLESAENTSFASFGVIDFSAASLGITGTVNSVNSLTLDLFDDPSAFSSAGPVPVNFYLSTDTTDSIQPGGPLKYLNNQTIDGVGTQLDTLFSLGTGSYSNSGKVGTDFTYNLTIPSAAQSYITNQMNLGGTIRLVATVGAPTGVEATYAGSTNSNTSLVEKLTAGLTTTALANNNSTLQIDLGAGNLTKAPATVIFDRVYKNATNATVSYQLDNTGPVPGTDDANYSVTAAAGNPGQFISNGSGLVGTEPLAAGGHTTITAGITPSNIHPGDVSPGSPVTSTITVHNQRNSNDPDITIKIQANQVVTDRFVDSAGSDVDATHSGAGTDFGRILIGKGFVTMPVTLDTENDLSTVDDRNSDSLTSVRLLGNTTVTPTGTTPNTNFNEAQVTVAAGASDVDFVNGSNQTVRMVTFKPLSGAGGTFTSATGANYDWVGIPLTNIDNATGLVPVGTTVPTADFGRINVGGTLYQQANLTTTGSTPTTLVLNNLKHTVLNLTLPGATTTTDIGLRVGAKITGSTLLAQNGFTVTGFTNGTDVVDNSNTTASVSFASAGKLNGAYAGNLTVQTQTDDQTIIGAAANDIAPVVFPLSTTVAGNAGNGTANILANGSLAGYNINRGTGVGKNSTITFLAGTSTSGGNISVAWADGVNTTASDKATVGNTASGLYVLQMTYDNTAITNGASSPTLASDIGNKFIGAVNGDGAVTPVEINGGYDNNLVLGHYGIDTSKHVVWAVVNYAGDFEVTQRVLGDANGDGNVDLTDLSTVLNNFGSTTALWSTGNFDGASTIDLTDLSDVLNNFGSSVPTASVGGVATPAIGEVPEPASLGLLSVALLPLLKRRRR